MDKHTVEQYKIRYQIELWECSHKQCDNPGTQIAHRIANTKTNIRKYGAAVIRHNFNLAVACCLYCNSSFNIGNNPMKAAALVALIRERGSERLTAEQINKHIETEVTT